MSFSKMDSSSRQWDLAFSYGTNDAQKTMGIITLSLDDWRAA